MSTQSIIHKTVSDLADDADKLYMCMADAYLLKRKFGIGDSYSREDFIKLNWLDRVLCEDHCGLKDFLKKTKEKFNLLILKYI
ncbi:MAG: hypothetical protein PQJ49_14175 [Sphaerochaetaceae bacterium]|nr:hypothetical protein [Sphaerochaetaceae bacterium]